MRSRTWLRGALSLAVLGALAGAALMSPVSAGPDASKKFVNKRIKRLRTQIESSLLGETTVVTETDTTPASVSDDEHTVKCPAGFQALGGGPVGDFDAIGVAASVPSVGGTPPTAGGVAPFADGWFTRVFSFDGDSEPYRVSVICAKPAA